MNRFRSLLKRLDDIKNEELFPICTTQIAELYKQQPQKYGVILFHNIKDFITHKLSFKRLVGAALFEKITKDFILSENTKDYLFNKKVLNLMSRNL